MTFQKIHFTVLENSCLPCLINILGPFYKLLLCFLIAGGLLADILYFRPQFVAVIKDGYTLICATLLTFVCMESVFPFLHHHPNWLDDAPVIRILSFPYLPPPADDKSDAYNDFSCTADEWSVAGGGGEGKPKLLPRLEHLLRKRTRVVHAGL